MGAFGEMLLRVASELFCAVGLVAVVGIAIDLQAHQLLFWLQHRRCWRQPCSSLTRELAPLLLSEDTDLAIEAASRLAAARDRSAVPHIMHALKACVEAQQPGWRERGEGFTIALAQIGDGRALPLLRELEDVRGIGFIPAVRRAILLLEPRSCLLRAGTTPGIALELLVIPAQGESTKELASLVRPVSGL